MAIEDMLRRLLRFEALITSASTRFINLPKDEIDAALEGALAEIGRFSEVDRSYIFLVSEDFGSMTNTHEWCAEGIPTQIQELEDVPSSSLPWFMGFMERGDVFHVPRVSDLGPEAAGERRVFESGNIQSLVCVPMFLSGRLIGFVGFDGVRKEKTWDEEDIKLLRIFGEIVANAIGRKRAAEALEKSELRASVLRERLLEAQKLEALGRLAGGIAHDFNNILAVIVGLASVAREGVDSRSELSGDLAQIIQAAERAASLTGQLLAFGKQQLLAPERFDLNEEVGRLLPMLRRLAPDKIAVTFEPDAETLLLEADRGQIAQILINLVTNAAEALSSAEGRIRINATRLFVEPVSSGGAGLLAPGLYAVLSVSDDGPGIEPETRGRIFEPFFSTKGFGRNSGLGLATVYGIVAQHGGRVEVMSEPGLGATFRVYLRAVEGELNAREEGLSEPLTGRVLLVEDNQDLRCITGRLLAGAGFEVLEAADAAAALAIVGNGVADIDLLLTDVIMPGRSGKDLARELSVLLPQMPVLYMSGYTDDVIGVAEQGEQRPLVLRKPFSRSQLLEAVRAALGSVS